MEKKPNRFSTILTRNRVKHTHHTDSEVSALPWSGKRVCSLTHVMMMMKRMCTGYTTDKQYDDDDDDDEEDDVRRR